jgi:hypothetical protein
MKASLIIYLCIAFTCALDPGQVKLQKMYELEANSKNGIIEFTVQQYR